MINKYIYIYVCVCVCVCVCMYNNIVYTNVLDLRSEMQNIVISICSRGRGGLGFISTDEGRWTLDVGRRNPGIWHPKVHPGELGAEQSRTYHDRLPFTTWLHGMSVGCRMWYVRSTPQSLESYTHYPHRSGALAGREEL
jgi:hypothetical protein